MLQNSTNLPDPVFSVVVKEELHRRQLSVAINYFDRLSEEEQRQWLEGEKEIPGGMSPAVVFEALCHVLFRPRMDLLRQEMRAYPTEQLAAFLKAFDEDMRKEHEKEERVSEQGSRGSHASKASRRR